MTSDKKNSTPSLIKSLFCIFKVTTFLHVS